jgi:hypothetical protein
MRIVLVSANAAPIITHVDEDELTEVVAEHVEVISGPGWRGYTDRDGAVDGLPFNFVATDLAEYLGWYDAPNVLVGPVVFVGEPDAYGYDNDVPEFVVRAALKYTTVTGR